MANMNGLNSVSVPKGSPAGGGGSQKSNTGAPKGSVQNAVSKDLGMKQVRGGGLTK